MTLNPYDKRETSKNRIVSKTMFKTNTFVKKMVHTQNNNTHIDRKDGTKPDTKNA